MYGFLVQALRPRSKTTCFLCQGFNASEKSQAYLRPVFFCKFVNIGHFLIRNCINVEFNNAKGDEKRQINRLCIKNRSKL